MSEASITAKDSSPIPSQEQNADWLYALASTPIEDLVINFGGRQREHESLVHTNPQGRWYAGRYIGHVEYQGRRITIEPRFDVDIGEWLADILRLPVVPDIQGSLEEGPFLDHLLAVIWGSGLVRAAKHGLPRLRRAVQHTGYSVRGRLKVRETVAQRVRGRSRLVSESTERTLENPIVRTAVAAYEVLHRRLVMRGVSEDQWIPPQGRGLVPAMIRSCGSRPELPSRREIRRIRYSPITETYRPFVELSEQIARMRGGTPDVTHMGKKISGLLLDVAELWELFVVNTARAGLPGFQVVHGALHSGPEWHVGHNPQSEPLQPVVPDLLLKKNGLTAVIADAKYKLLAARRGRPRGYERSDLYQLITYLTEATSESRPDLLGLLVYPESPTDEGSTRAEQDGPWHLLSGHHIRFVQLPRRREEARRYWAKLISGSDIPARAQ